MLKKRQDKWEKKYAKIHKQVQLNKHQLLAKHIYKL